MTMSLKAVIPPLRPVLQICFRNTHPVRVLASFPTTFPMFQCPVITKTSIWPGHKPSHGHVSQDRAIHIGSHALRTQIVHRLDFHTFGARKRLNEVEASINHPIATLETLNFDNRILRSVPIDPNTENTVRQVPGACFTLVAPTPVVNPHVVVVSMPALALLDISESEVSRKDFAEYFSGNKLLPGSETAAHCYCGTQFGKFNGQLGDGATQYLGEIVNRQGERWEVQLKGAGRTPYSKSMDGRKVLRSSIREFLCSEAMHHLGIPTTRAGSCVTSDTFSTRDVLYTGDPIQERCSLVFRISPSFIRIGSFQICTPQDAVTGRQGPSVGHPEVIEQLTDYVIDTFYPRIREKHKEDKKAACVELFTEVVKRTARLVAQWMSIGWTHGVLNTDNISIVGVTMDYGPYGFMDSYVHDFVCNGSDKNGRYAYNQQAEICKWNCEKLAESLAQMSYMDMESLYPVLDLYKEEYDKHYLELMRKKFGLLNPQPDDREFVDSFHQAMADTGADFTTSFRGLNKMTLPGSPDFESSKNTLLDHLIAQCCSVDKFAKLYSPRVDQSVTQYFLTLLESDPEEAAKQLYKKKLLEKTIYAEVKRTELTNKLQQRTREQKALDDQEHWKTWLENYVVRLQREVEGARDLKEANSERLKLMNGSNPRFILRNYIAQNAIASAEKGDYREVHRVLQLLREPYSDNVNLEVNHHSGIKADEGATGTSTPCHRRHVSAYDSKPPDWAQDLRFT